jgi:TnpA family transposase
MKLDYDKRLQDIEKAKLKVLEEQFYFDSQIKIKTEMNEAKEKNFEVFQ